MKRALTVSAVAVGFLASGCVTVRPATVPADPARAERAVAAWQAARAKAWGPRRFKALYGGVVSQTVGATARGYVALWWDGSRLHYKSSAPLAGAGSSGTLSRLGGGSPLPGVADPSAAIGVVLGVLDVAADPAHVTVDGNLTRLALEGGAFAFLDPEGRIVKLLLGSAEVRYEPGAGLPRSIDVRGDEGSAKLSLESYGPWPAGEPLPEALR